VGVVVLDGSGRGTGIRCEAVCRSLLAIRTGSYFSR
jgi:hypothetical protein